VVALNCWLSALYSRLRNNFNSPGVMKRIERALQHSDGPLSVYLMLTETKVDVLKQLQRKEDINQIHR